MMVGDGAALVTKLRLFDITDMSDSEKNNERIEEREMKRYWLGELAPDTEHRLEERFSSDDKLFDQLLGVREELFDAYARGELSETERAQFERNLLQSPSDRAQLEFVRSFTGALDEEIIGGKSAERRTVSGWLRFPRLGWVIACAAALAGAGWLISDNIRLRGQIARLQSEQAAQRQLTRELEERLAQTGSGAATQPSPQVAPLPSPAPRGKEAVAASIQFISLPLRNLREASSRTIQIEPEKRTLRFKLLIDPSDVFPGYQLDLSQNGTVIKRWRGLRLTRNGGIGPTVDLHVTELSDSEYSFELRGVSDDGVIENAGRASFHIKP
jgi:anti-sigma factor RsiW